jgi:hypothetical protein
MENLSEQASNAAGNAQATATNAVGNVSSTATNAVGDVSSKASDAVGDIQSKIPKPPAVPQLPKLPNVPQLPGVPEFKQKELPVPKKLKNNKFKDKLAAAAAKAKQLAAKGQAAVAGAQAKAQAAIAGAQAKAEAAVATVQEKAQKAVSDAQDKVKQGIASAEEKATATAEKAKESAKDEIKKVQEGNGGKPLTEEEKDKIVINKTTEAAVKDAKPTQDAAKAALAKSNETIGKPDLSTPMKFIKSYDTPKNGNRFYFYQQRDSVGVYYTSVHDKKDPFSYKIQNFAKKTAESGIDVATRYCNEVEDDA